MSIYVVELAHLFPRLMVLWQEQRQLTHENVQRKQARTGEEREEEEEEQISESESEDEDNEIIYNPKNLPLGWDGKVRQHCTATCTDPLWQMTVRGCCRGFSKGFQWLLEISKSSRNNWKYGQGRNTVPIIQSN